MPSKIRKACLQAWRLSGTTGIISPGGWKRKHTPIPTDLAHSVTEVRTSLSGCTYINMLIALLKFIYSSLKDELGLLAKKRPRRYANENYLLVYAEQLWAKDWFVYQKPETRVSERLGIIFVQRLQYLANWRVYRIQLTSWL
jgi:hypothetical protein